MDKEIFNDGNYRIRVKHDLECQCLSGLHIEWKEVKWRSNVKRWVNVAKIILWELKSGQSFTLVINGSSASAKENARSSDPQVILNQLQYFSRVLGDRQGVPLTMDMIEDWMSTVMMNKIAN